MIYTVTFNPAIDYVVRLDRELQVGDVNRARGEDCVLGGKGINVSGVLAQLGCESVALGFVAGETGAWLERGLAAQGLKTDFVHLDHGMTRINVKIKAGQETELNGAGPDIPEAAMQALEQKLDALQKDDILVLAGSIPASLAQTTYERLLARLEGRGIRAVVDATRDLLVNVLPYKPFLIKPNNHELSEITGVRLTNDKEIAAAAHMMQDKGARNVLVSMAGDGALLLDEHGTVYRIGCPRGKPDDPAQHGEQADECQQQCRRAHDLPCQTAVIADMFFSVICHCGCVAPFGGLSEKALPERRVARRAG